MDESPRNFRDKKYRRNIEWHNEHDRLTFAEMEAYHKRVVATFKKTVKDTLPLMTDEDIINIIIAMESTQIG